MKHEQIIKNLNRRNTYGPSSMLPWPHVRELDAVENPTIISNQTTKIENKQTTTVHSHYIFNLIIDKKIITLGSRCSISRIYARQHARANVFMKEKSARSNIDTQISIF